MSTDADHLERRMDSLDRRLSDTSKTIFEKIDGLSKSSSDKIDSLAGIVNALALDVRQNKPASSLALLGAAGVICALVSAAVTAIFFLVDARVGAKTERANRFVEEMTTEGKLYVDLDRIDRRLKALEKPERWQTATETARR